MKLSWLAFSFEAADQVGDRDVELGRVHHGRVEQQGADVAAHGLGLAGRHAEQHLELDAVVDRAPLRGEPGVGDVEQVVAGDAELTASVRSGVIDQSSTRL